MENHPQQRHRSTYCKCFGGKPGRFLDYGLHYSRFCPLSTKGHFHYGIDESVCKSIETGLNLHPITYNTIMNNGGEFTKFFEVSQPGSKHPKRISKAALMSSQYRVDNLRNIELVLKVANNYNISYSCVSLSYDQTTGTTNILLHGAREEEWLGIMEFIHRERKLWSHPLLIPLALMHHQTSMAGNYEASIDRSLFDAERAIGYVIPGLLSPSAPFGRGPEADLKDITRRLHSVRTELASLGFSTQYVLNCSDFLIKTMRDMHDKVLSTSEKLLSDQEEILQEQLEHLKSKTQCLQSHARSLQERAKSQVGLVSSTIFNLRKPFINILVNRHSLSSLKKRIVLVEL